MSTIEHLEQEIRNLNSDELARFRNWFLEYDARNWDEQIEQDSRTGRLDKLADAAVQSWRQGRATDL